MRRPLLPLGITQGVPPAALVGPEELAREAGLSQVLRLGSNESPFGPSPLALRAMENELQSAHRYADPRNQILKEALAARHGVHADEVCVGAGMDDLLGLAVRAFLAPRAPAVCALGTFPTFEMHVTGYGGRLERVPYRGTKVDLAGLLAACPADGALVYLANPDNPTGSYWPWSQVADFVEKLPDGSLLIHDEAYTAFLPVAERPPAGLVDARVLRMRTFSKEYGLAGMRIGYAIGSREAVAALEEVRLLYGINRPAQAAALASLEDDAFIDDVLERLAAGREEYVRLGRELGVSTAPSVTNFVMFDFEDAARAECVRLELLRRGIHIRKPQAPPLAGYVRISVGTPEERAVLAVRLREVVELVRNGV